MQPIVLPLSLLVVALAAPLLSQEGNSGGWKLEEVRTLDGRSYRGLIRGEVGGEIEFVEVVRAPSKPMYLVVRPFEVKTIVAQRRLNAEEHRKLIELVDAFRYRSVIEAGRMEDVSVVPLAGDSGSVLQYRGPWFTLNSTADDETTRRSIVRIEQIFRAYRQLIPPRARPQRELRILLLGSLDEYRQYLRDHELEITNPAFFAEKANLIVAASDLTEYASRLALSREKHQHLRAQLNAIADDLEPRLADTRKRLQSQGVPKVKIDDEMNARRAAWKVEQDESLKQLAAADRRNAARFADVTEQMFRRLYHEGLHAYLENYVYPHDRHDVPIWLNEGLAQVFQSGQLDGDALRIEAVLASALQLVHDDLRSDKPLRLDELLLAGRREFLAGPEAEGRTALLYAYAWALAHYLMFNDALLGGRALDEYVSPRDAQAGPLVQFERLIGTTLAEFEPHWRKEILNLRP